MSKEILAGATDQTIDVFIQDSSSTTGAGLTGLAYNTASLVCYYRKGATGSATALTLATQTVGGAHSDGGFVQIDATNMPGLYRLDLSDTMVATAGLLKIMLKGATNMATCPIEIEVVAANKYDGVRMGLTALPNAAADAAGGLPISDAGGLDLDNRMPSATSIGNMNIVFTTDFASNYDTTLDQWVVNVTRIEGSDATDQIRDAVVDDATRIDASSLNTATVTTIPAILDDTDLIDDGTSGLAKIATDVAAILVDTGTTLDGKINTIDGIVDDILVDTAEIGAAGAGLTEAGGTGDHLTAINLPDQTMNITGDITGNLSGSVGSVTGAVGSVTGAVGSVTGNVGGNVTGSIGSLATQAKADVNAEVLDVMNVDTFAEPGQGAPAATTSLVAKIGYLFKAWRNKKTKTATASNLYNDAGDTIDQKTTDSDDGTTATRGEQSTGP